MENVVEPYGTVRRINYNGEHFPQLYTENALCISNIFLHENLYIRRLGGPQIGKQITKFTTYV